MKYEKKITMKNGSMLLLRNGTEADAEIMCNAFKQMIEETDYLLTYPDENTMDTEREAAFLKEKTESENEIEILAFVDGFSAGTAGIEAVGSRYKVKHRAEFGIAVLKAYWGMGIGRMLAEACIERAKAAGYAQLELTVVADNERALRLYKKLGFVEYGRNPKGFRSRACGFQEIVQMRLEL